MLCEHLYQLYPSMPKYAADVSESLFIKIYDQIMTRYQGCYGKQPDLFIKSPLYVLLMGAKQKYVGFSKLGMASEQNIVIAMGKNTAKKIRINHYQKAVYG